MKQKIWAACLLWAGVLLTPLGLWAQHRIEGKPFTLTHDIANYRQDLQQIDLPVDKQKLKKDLDSLRASSCKECKGDYYGKALNMDLDVKTDVNLISADDERKIWLVKVCSEGAEGMQFYFDKYKLPEGARLFFYNDTKDFVFGAFTEKNNLKNLRFGTQPMPGSCFYIEYSEPVATTDTSQLHIYKGVHVFLRSVAGQKGASGSCEQDANCSQWNAYKDEMKAVAAIYYLNSSGEWTEHCTGTLIHQATSQRKAYLLTAKHCANYPAAGLPIPETLRAFDEGNWVFIFNYESEGCNDPAYLNTASNTNSLYGAAELLVGNDVDSDYALMELYVKPEANNYPVKYLGWDRNGTQPSSVITIHHPRGDVKKISLSTNITKVNWAYLMNGTWGSNGGAQNAWRISWSSGITEPGSSGAPLIDTYTKRIIGVMSNGSSYCTSPQAYDYFHMFSYFWSKGTGVGQTTAGLQPYLDPTNIAAGSKAINTDQVILPSHCSDLSMNVGETGFNCGGECLPCPTCNDQIENGQETSIDCGGPVCTPCPVPSCTDNKRNQGEWGIDCGGPCQPCVNLCGNGILDGNEWEKDCGGSCTPCPNLIENSSLNVNTSCATAATLAGAPNSFPLISSNFNCLTGQWRASHGDPYIRYVDNDPAFYGLPKSVPFIQMRSGDGYLLYNGVTYGYPYSVSEGVFYQMPQYFTPNLEYTLYFAERNLWSKTPNATHQELGVKTLRASIAEGLTHNNAFYAYPESLYTAESIADCMLPLNASAKDLAYLDLDAPPSYTYDYFYQTYWKYHGIRFFVDRPNEYNQIWFTVYGSQGDVNKDVVARIGFVGLDNIYLTAHARCRYLVELTSSNLFYEVMSGNWIKTSGTVTLDNLQPYKFSAADYIEFNDGFSTSTGTEMVAEIKGCPQARMDEVPAFTAFDVNPHQPYSEERPVAQVTNLNFTVYPSPTKGVVNVRFGPNLISQEIEQVQVLDLYGNVVLTQRSSNLKAGEPLLFDLSDQKDGMYIMRITSEGKNYIEKVILQK